MRERGGGDAGGVDRNTTLRARAAEPEKAHEDRAKSQLLAMRMASASLLFFTCGCKSVVERREVEVGVIKAQKTGRHKGASKWATGRGREKPLSQPRLSSP